MRGTHLGYTLDWKQAEGKFKCPSHGSGYDREGINFEGPAPRPTNRARIAMTPDDRGGRGPVLFLAEGQRDNSTIQAHTYPPERTLK